MVLLFLLLNSKWWQYPPRGVDDIVFEVFLFLKVLWYILSWQAVAMAWDSDEGTGMNIGMNLGMNADYLRTQDN